MLNGRTYDDCPPRIRRGLDRRRISATILLAESSSSVSTGDDIRRTVFERLNTGGQNLVAQELRNCLYSGPFNDLLIQLAGARVFNELWNIPPYEDNIRRHHISQSLRENRFFKRMTDCEIVLRFFAFRKRSWLRGAVRTILDKCMERHRESTDDMLDELRRLFLSRIELSKEIFGKKAFRLPGNGNLSIPLYDATMVALHEQYAHRSELIKNRKALYQGLCDLFSYETNYEIIVGRPNTADAIKARQELLRDLFREYI